MDAGEAAGYITYSHHRVSTNNPDFHVVVEIRVRQQCMLCERIAHLEVEPFIRQHVPKEYTANITITDIFPKR